jgi:hypothetical protein
MRIPTVWTREVWARAMAAPSIPQVRAVSGHLVSSATAHHADYVGDDRWAVDFLPGRQLTLEQATAAMRIAVAPDRLEVDRWAALLGMTAAEVRGYAEVPA